jgi:glutathione S-transferase
LVEVDLTNKPKLLLDINPSGTIPAMTVDRFGREYSFYDSMVVVEAVDRLTDGPGLFPRDNAGVVDPVLMAMIKNRLLLVDKLISAVYPLFRNPKPSKTMVATARDNFGAIEALLAKQKRLASDITSEPSISAADISLIPHLEAWMTIKDELLSSVFADGFEIPYIQQWHDELVETESIQKFRPANVRMQNLLRSHREGFHRGIRLPLTTYDQRLTS